MCTTCEFVYECVRERKRERKKRIEEKGKKRLVKENRMSKRM